MSLLSLSLFRSKIVSSWTISELRSWSVFSGVFFLFLFVVLTFLCWASFETIYIKTSFNKFKSNRCGIQRYSLRTNSSLNVRCFLAILLDVITNGAVLTANIIDTVTDCLQATAETKYQEKKMFILKTFMTKMPALMH